MKGTIEAQYVARLIFVILITNNFGVNYLPVGRLTQGGSSDYLM